MDIAEKNDADIVCARTCLFAADYDFDPLVEGLVYDWHDKFYFNIVHPANHYIGHKNIMKCLYMIIFVMTILKILILIYWH